MDDRKKQIGELEQHKREQLVFLDSLLARLGETLMGRAAGSLKEDNAGFTEMAVFSRLQKESADSGAAIQAVEEQIRKFRELEENIEAKEQEAGAAAKELAISLCALGKLLLDAPSGTAIADSPAFAGGADYAGFCAPYRDQADALLTKVISLEERIAGLEERESGNVFAWVGKSAQGLVLRSFLTKAQENLEQLRRNVGERYSRRDMAALPGGKTGKGEIENLCAEIDRRRAESRVFMQHLTELKEERHNISGSFHAEGGPLKQIQTLKNNIAHVQDELKVLYRNIGAEAAGIGDAQRRKIIDSLITPEDKETLHNVTQANRLIQDDAAAIEQLQASLAIDEEKEKIEKYRQMIQDKKDKIAQAEKSIVEFEEGIMVCETNIKKLQGETNGSKNDKKTSRKKNS